MSSRDNMNRFAIVAGCLLLANALGCMSDYHTSDEDCEKLREMMGSWHSRCECATENQFDDLESAVDLLISKLNAFCQAHKVGRAALLSAIDMKLFVGLLGALAIIEMLSMCLAAMVGNVLEFCSCLTAGVVFGKF